MPRPGWHLGRGVGDSLRLSGSSRQGWGWEGRRGGRSWCPQPAGPCRPQGILLRRQLPPFLNGFFQNSEPVVVRIMGTVSDVLHRLGAHGAGAQSLGIAVKTRSFFDDVSAPVRAWPPRRPLFLQGQEGPRPLL